MGNTSASHLATICAIVFLTSAPLAASPKFEMDGIGWSSISATESGKKLCPVIEPKFTDSCIAVIESSFIRVFDAWSVNQTTEDQREKLKSFILKATTDGATNWRLVDTNYFAWRSAQSPVSSRRSSRTTRTTCTTTVSEQYRGIYSSTATSTTTCVTN